MTTDIATAKTLAAILTPKQEHFARCMAEGQTASDAYRAAFDVAPTTSLETVHKRSYELRHAPRVAARVQQHRQQIAAAFVITEAELRKDLHDLVSVDATELSGVRRVNCRRCWGVDGQLTWIDEREYRDAVGQADAANSAVPGSAVPPTFGGFFKVLGERNEACKHCGGEGVARPYVADTTKLSATARKLYRGHKINKRDGTIELLTHDQTTLRDQLNKSLGLYKSVSLNLNADVPAGLEHASVNDMLDILRTLHPVAAPPIDATVVAVQEQPPAAADAQPSEALNVTQQHLPEPKPWDAHRRKPNRLPIVITPDGATP
jgi:phage terminase small subunit